MNAMFLEHPSPIEGNPLRAAEVEVPIPSDGEILVRVKTCGVCRTDLHGRAARPKV
jgi:alcohol dehydrogenase, propanol-preferring